MAKSFITHILLVAYLGCLAGPLASQADDAPVDAKKDGGEAAKADDQYWIGIQAAPIDDVLKSHLQLKHGLIIEQIVADAPAATSGLERHDVLVKFNDVALKDLNDLVGALSNSKDQKVKLEIVRGGKTMNIEVTPVKRPVDLLDAAEPNRAAATRTRLWQKDGEKWDGKTPLRVQVIRPGFAIPNDVAGRLEGVMKMPAGTRISINKEGDGPATITVEKDGKKWQVTEDKIGELPDDVRSFVQRMLGQNFGAMIDLRELGGGDGWKNMLDEKAGQEETREQIERWMKSLPREGRPREWKSNLPDDIQSQLDETIKRLDEVRKQLQGTESIEELRRELKNLREDVDKLKGDDETKK